MGCKESKHKVAAGNIIITPSPSKRHSNIDIVGNNNNDVQKIPENPANAISPVQKQECLKANVDSNAINSDKGTANVNAKESRNAKGDSYKVDEKVRESEIVEVFNDKEIKKENVGEELNKEKEGVVEEKGKGNLVCEDSPNNFLSSRKDDETIEGIITEGISGTSVYYTPHKEGASEESKKLENIGEEEKESFAEIRNETKTEESGNVTEGNSVKEAEEAADLVEENPSEATRNSVEAADLGVQVNLVKEPAKAITIAKENPIEAGEEKLVEIVTEASINEETQVKEEVDAANATKEHLVLQEKVANVAEENEAKAEAIVDTSKQNPVKEEAGPTVEESKGAIVEESKGAVNKISTVNEENVTETSEEDSKTN